MEGTDRVIRGKAARAFLKRMKEVEQGLHKISPEEAKRIRLAYEHYASTKQ